MPTLRDLVDVWRSAAHDFSALARQVDDTDWLTPTDCPGWTVKDVLAHTASLESELAGATPATVELPSGLTHIRNSIGAYVEQGVLARRDVAATDLIAELDEAVERRTQLLADEPLDDPEGDPPITPGAIGWNWGTLLRNRPLDLWVHEQDIRRAVGKPGGLDTPAALHTQEVIAAALPYVAAKKAQAPPGSTVLVDVTGPVSRVYAVQVGDDGRGKPTDPDGLDPTVRLTLDTESFTILGAGRRDASALPVKVDGDAALAERILDALAVTP